MWKFIKENPIILVLIFLIGLIIFLIGGCIISININ